MIARNIETDVALSAERSEGTLRLRPLQVIPVAGDPKDDQAWVSLISAIPHVSPWRLIYATTFKRAVDIVASATLLLVLAFIVVVAMLLIRLDSPGPAIFKQERIGRNGKRFNLYKLRTMQHSSSKDIVWLTNENGQSTHKVRNDPRVTRIGQLLRRTSIDELPQLLNIVKGDMSLIGPRPELPVIVDNYESWQHDRHLVRPGLTGWWQVTGRSDLPMHENTELDLFYVQRMSFLLDWQIAIRTIRVVVKGRGAF